MKGELNVFDLFEIVLKSLQISRNLAKSLAIDHNASKFEELPECNTNIAMYSLLSLVLNLVQKMCALSL